MVVANNPQIGKAKVANLRGILVYKFKMVNQEILLAYSYNPNMVEFHAFGSHGAAFARRPLAWQRVEEAGAEEQIKAAVMDADAEGAADQA